ncbi:hypothetical protein QTP86_008564 [Hemibagrus guttatus]|nr:hypothetical protein QTP86_008564 [Hemibagrus guttatus]
MAELCKDKQKTVVGDSPCFTFSSTGFPASSVITVSVILLLLLIGTIILILTLQNRRKMRDLSNKKFISETVHVGGHLTLSCKYPESLRSNPKFLCKRLQNGACSYKDSVKQSRKYVNKGKFSLYDDRAKQTFSVSVRGVTEQDSGEYWCGAEADWTSNHGYRVYFTRINLTVTGFPASSVITVSVILLLLLIGIIILAMALQKRCRMQAEADSVGRHSDQTSGNVQGVLS